MYVRRGVSILALVASVAPLLGLLGTVTGMIGTFAMITSTVLETLEYYRAVYQKLFSRLNLGDIAIRLLFQAILYRFGDAIVRRLERLALAVLHAKEKTVSVEAYSDGVALCSERSVSGIDWVFEQGGWVSYASLVSASCSGRR